MAAVTRVQKIRFARWYALAILLAMLHHGGRWLENTSLNPLPLPLQLPSALYLFPLLAAGAFRAVQVIRFPYSLSEPDTQGVRSILMSLSKSTIYAGVLLSAVNLFVTYVVKSPLSLALQFSSDFWLFVGALLSKDIGLMGVICFEVSCFRSSTNDRGRRSDTN